MTESREYMNGLLRYAAREIEKAKQRADATAELRLVDCHPDTVEELRRILAQQGHLTDPPNCIGTVTVHVRQTFEEICEQTRQRYAQYLRSSTGSGEPNPYPQTEAGTLWRRWDRQLLAAMACWGVTKPTEDFTAEETTPCPSDGTSDGTSSG